ncbi:MAG: ferrous iron transport protein A [Eubacterium sp.]|nr:ferrous iron transport protein A [Eubacterium sp.]
MTLYQMKINEVGIIDNIEDSSGFSRRLFDLGIMTGQRVKCTNKGLFGSPVLYEICGSKIALRKGDAIKVGVIV